MIHSCRCHSEAGDIELADGSRASGALGLADGRLDGRSVKRNSLKVVLAGLIPHLLGSSRSGGGARGAIALK